MQPLKRIEVAFFLGASGKEPVRDWLKSLPAGDRKIIGDDLQALEFGWPVGMPLCRPMGKGLYELRSTLPNRIARLLFIAVDEQLVLLHGFIKKTQKTPQADLDLALTRKKLVERG